MIEVRIEPGCVTAKGHAGYAPEGSDIVCAAVSILLFSLAQRLRELEAAGCVRVETLRLEAGDAELRWTSGDAAFMRDESAVVRAGLRMLAARYPGNVRVSEE